MRRNQFSRQKIFSLFASLLFCSVIAAAKEQEAAYTVEAGPHKVATLSEVWTDSVRDREVPVKIYYPEDAPGPFPVIVFSHGLGGSRNGYEYLGSHWASNGYVSVHLQHKGSDDKVWKGKLRPMEALREAVKDPANHANRPLDVRFAVDQLEKLGRETPPLKDKLDMKRLGIAGHSYGAWTTLVIAGEAVAGSGGKDSKFYDPRFKAAIAMSAPAPAVKQKEKLDRAFAGVKIPVFHMTGTLDDSPIGETSADQRRIPFDHISGSDQYLVNFTGGDHMIFSGRGLMPGNFRKDATFQKYILIGSTAFWDAYLKDNAQAKSWLGNGDFEKSLGKEGSFEKKTK